MRSPLRALVAASIARRRRRWRPPPAPRDARPNFVILFADDLGYGDLGTFGHPTIATPNLDRMAAEGLKLTSFYAAPLCTPSRAALLTGRYPNRSGLYRVLFPEDTDGHAARGGDAGGGARRRAAIAPWRSASGTSATAVRSCPPRTGSPATSGCSTATTCARLAPTSRCASTATTRRCPARSIKALLTERYTEEALRVHSRIERPSVLPLPRLHHAAPCRSTPRERFAGKSRRGLYGDAVETIDWSVGEILRALRDAGLDESTLVLFTSDNGPAISRGLEGGSAGLLRGGKGSSYEGGMREPCIVRWPDADRAGAGARRRRQHARSLPHAARARRDRGRRPTASSTAAASSRCSTARPLGDRPIRSTTSRPASSKRCARASGSSARPPPKGADAIHAAAIAAFLERTRSEGRSFTAAEVLGAAAIPELYDLDVDPSEHVERRRRASGDRRSAAPADDRAGALGGAGSRVRHRQGRSRDHRAQANRPAGR